MLSLPLFHRIAGKRVVVIGAGDMADAKRRLIERAGGICCGETEAHHADLGFVALDDARVAEIAARRLKAQGLLVNVADRPDLCDFTLPSVLDREPVQIAIGTSGASAGLAKHIRLRLETLLPQSLGQLAEALAAVRDRMRAHYPDGNQRRKALDAALSPNGFLDPMQEASAGRVEAWLGRASPPAGSRTETINITSADPDDLTLRQARLLGEADLVVFAPTIAEPILVRARADAVRRTLADYNARDPDEPPPGLTIILTDRAF
ncbi:precorrin-2 dehydrogenase/sirohydrochlorin ferrochelatase family protein [Pseudopontixanthobacter vadosimaris]|uniref:precorrin-2 dehydrogenase/sirohydrochlorin ferrochelatase family protein n=1 Tax=Pseudopontixanthobacter vadosimaris TaxID=2726450 RepID=UPI0014755D67|nr:bifunctional precorrin-2 dehydrogenase/sirohydrochlorin ferrochelatase [Pseudopontixanthobacter vadosimaris]